MLKWTLTLLLLGYIAFSILYVHFRGNLRHRPMRQLSDHSSFLAPINMVLYFFSKIKDQPYHSESSFPELDVIKENWEMIRDEALTLESHIKGSDKKDDAGFNSFFRRGWKRFYLKWYGVEHDSAKELCPKTTALLASIPTVKAAMFAELPAGGKLMKHRDPYAGSIRYHLGLRTPNSDDCFISVDGETYSWRDGEAVLFDETYIHYVENNTDQSRLILFCDVERPLATKFANNFNRWFSRNVMAASAAPNDDNDDTGGINRLFGKVYKFREQGKKLKAANKPIYLLIKWTLLALPLALFLLFVWWI